MHERPLTPTEQRSPATPYGAGTPGFQPAGHHADDVEFNTQLTITITPPTSPQIRPVSPASSVSSLGSRFGTSMRIESSTQMVARLRHANQPANMSFQHSAVFSTRHTLTVPHSATTSPRVSDFGSPNSQDSIGTPPALVRVPALRVNVSSSVHFDPIRLGAPAPNGEPLVISPLSLPEPLFTFEQHHSVSFRQQPDSVPPARSEAPVSTPNSNDGKPPQG